MYSNHNLSEDSRNICAVQKYTPNKATVIDQKVVFIYDIHSNEYFTEHDSSAKSFFSAGWQSFAYSTSNLMRHSGASESYLHRKVKTQNAHISWCFDFAATGLVLDQVSFRMNYDERGCGQVLVNISGDKGLGRYPYLTSGTRATITKLRESNFLRISVNFIGESEQYVTQIMNTSADDSDDALIVEIELKQPYYTFGRTLILIGLMRSNRKKNAFFQQKKSKKPSRAGGNGAYLYLDVEKCVHLPCLKNGKIALPQVHCALQSSTENLLMTKVHWKSFDPIWNEYLTFSNVEEPRNSTLEVSVRHKRSWFKKTPETLGYIELKASGKWTNEFVPDPTEPRNGLLNKNLSASCDLLDAIDGPKVIINNTTNESNTDEESALENNQSEMGVDTLNQSEFEDNQLDQSKVSKESTKSKSKPNWRACKKKPIKSKHRLNIYRSGSVSNLIEEDQFHDKVVDLGEDHWAIMLENPDQWFYCWHPLLGVQNVL